MDLSPREIEVLTTIMEDYITSAGPVGSRTVSKRSRLGLSPASIRNFMADLTDKGYLEQPHTSAGRVPTALAFRFYLDTVMQVSPLAEKDQQMIRSTLGSSGLEVTDILRQASRILSSISQQVSMVITPRQNFVRWRQVEFVLLKPRLVMTLLVLQGGIVLNKLVETAEDLTADELIRYGNYLNSLFQGRTVFEVRGTILKELKNARQELDDLGRHALQLAQKTLQDEEEREVFVDGTINILDQPEFADIPTMRRLLGVLAERTRLLELLDKSLDQEGLRILLGQETEVTSQCECSLVSSPYSIKGYPIGVIGVIGPLRMDYAKVVPVVDYMSYIISELLRKRF